MVVLIGVLGLLTLIFISLICNSWWVLITGVGIGILAGAIIGSFAIQEAFQRWMATTADWQRRLGITAAVFGIIVMVILIAGMLSHKYASSLPCGVGGCSATTAVADTVNLTLVATREKPAELEMPQAFFKYCWPDGVDALTDQTIRMSGTTKIRIFTPKEGIERVEIQVTRSRVSRS